MLKKILLLLLLSYISGPVLSQAQEKESTLKAAYIYNFTRYVEWEKTSGEEDFIIGVIGTSSVTPPLTEIARTKTVNNKKIVMRLFEKPEDITYCHLLFIPQKLPFSLNTILNRVGKGTLTISEEPGFAKLGTAFNFVIKNDKLKFEANIKALYLASLKASSQLLKLATIVD